VNRSGDTSALASLRAAGIVGAGTKGSPAALSDKSMVDYDERAWDFLRDLWTLKELEDWLAAEATTRNGECSGITAVDFARALRAHYLAPGYARGTTAWKFSGHCHTVGCH
jgi:hypothetical protein